MTIDFTPVERRTSGAWGGLICVVALGLLLAVAGRARADLYALGGSSGFTPPAVGQYDSNGHLVRSTPGLVESTDALAFSSDGWLYGAGNAIGMGHLARARPGGPLVWQSVVPLGGTASPYAGPGGLAAGPDGVIYAASNTFGNGQRGIFRYNPANGSFTLFAPATEPPSGVTGALGGLARSPAGDLYVTRFGIGVERYSGATGAPLGVVVPSSALADFSDIQFGPDGNLYAPTAQGVDRFNPDTGAPLAPFITALPGVAHMSFGGDGLLYLNVPASHQVLRYDALSGAFRDVFVNAEQYDLLAGTARRLGDIVYVTPEPGSAALLMSAAGGALIRRRRRGV